LHIYKTSKMTEAYTCTYILFKFIDIAFICYEKLIVNDFIAALYSNREYHPPNNQCFGTDSLLYIYALPKITVAN